MALIAILWVGLAGCGSAPSAGPAGSAAQASAQQGEILVMLPLAPAHFRPDANYGPGYAADAGSAARQRLAAALAREHKLKLITNWPMPALGVDCFVMAVNDTEAPGAAASRIAQDPRVESAQALQAFHTLGHNDPLYPLQPSAQLWHLAELHRVSTGRGVRIAEIDTAVDETQRDLAGQVEVARNFVDDRPLVGEDHGTEVAGIIAARADDHVGVAGVAPGARLLALRACWQETGGRSRCNSFTLAKALQFALDKDAAIINLSLAGPHDRLLERLLDAALKHRIVVVAAVDPDAADGGFPASLPGVLAVAAEDDRAAPHGALRAPGRDIPTTLPGGRWNFVSGASFAAAHVSGLTALIHELSPGLAPAKLGAALAGTSTAWPGNASDSMIDACAALAEWAPGCACHCGMPGEARLLMHR